MAGHLTPCPRPYCGGAILDGQCLLCGRNPTSPATVGGPRQRHQLVLPTGNIPATERQARDPFADLARRVLSLSDVAERRRA